MVEYQCSLIVRGCSVVGLDLNAVVGVQVFSVDGEAAAGGGLRVGGGEVCVLLLELRAVKTGSGDSLPKDLVSACEKGFLIAHNLLDFVFHGGDFRFQLFLHAAKFHQFLDFGFHAGI